jgi:hypothetical protein
MQQCRIIHCSLGALHVSNDIFTHHQKHLNCIYSLLYYTRMSLPTAFMGELEPAMYQHCTSCHSYISVGERPAAAHLLRSWVRIQRGHGYLSVVSVVCCQVEVSATS